MTPAVLIAGAYVLGAVPTGFWLGKVWKGVDVRRQGSGNLGATNVFRVLGPGPGLLTLAIDMGKGFLPVWTAQRLDPSVWLALSAGMAAIVGHTASVFVRFKGGKGVATSAGVFVALLPVPCAIALACFAASFALTRYVSISSMIAAAALAVSAFLLASPPALAWAAVGIALFVVWTHRENIRRLRQGTEHRIAWPNSRNG